jgi:nitroreductase
MEFKQVLGRRRSIRFFQPYRPVERAKIQKILEAARIASCAVNASYLRGVVVERDAIPEETLEKIKTPVAAMNYQLAPLYIFFYGDGNWVVERKGDTLHELVDAGALAPTHGWSHKFIDEFVYPQIIQPALQPGERRMKTIAFDCGVAACQALLTAYEEGLGGCFSGFNADIVKEAFDIPDHWIPMHALLLGYPAESWEAGGQRPRMPLEEQFFEGKYGAPFTRDEAVVEELKREGMLQTPGPLPWRKAEIRALARMFGLPE